MCDIVWKSGMIKYTNIHKSCVCVCMCYKSSVLVSLVNRRVHRKVHHLIKKLPLSLSLSLSLSLPLPLPLSLSNQIIGLMAIIILYWCQYTQATDTTPPTDLSHSNYSYVTSQNDYRYTTFRVMS